MVIHAMDLAVSEDVNPALVGGTNAYVSVWLTNFTAWEPDSNLQQDNDPPSLEPLAFTQDASMFYRGGPWRFDWSEDKSILTDNIVTQFESYRPTWWRIRWHECDHNESGRAGCDWTDEWTGGTLPESPRL